MVFEHERGQGYLWDGLVVLCDPSDFLALYGLYLRAIYGFWSADVVCGNWIVPDLVISERLF